MNEARSRYASICTFAPVKLVLKLRTSSACRRGERRAMLFLFYFFFFLFFSPAGGANDMRSRYASICTFVPPKLVLKLRNSSACRRGERHAIKILLLFLFYFFLFLFSSFFFRLQAGRTKRDEDAVAKNKTTVLKW